MASQRIAMVSLVVRDYDEAVDFFIGKLGFELIEDRPVPEQDKRWVVVVPPGSGARLLLARAASEDQVNRNGNQTGGRVFMFLYTDDFQRDFDMAGRVSAGDPSTTSPGRSAIWARDATTEAVWR